MVGVQTLNTTNTAMDSAPLVDDFSWYLVYSKPRQETVARIHLERQQFRVFLPLIEQRRRVRLHYQSVIEPLFPRYLFLGLASQQSLASVRSTRGVSGLVAFGGIPARISGPLVRAIQARGNASGVICSGQPAFQPGDRVRLVDGPMAGYEAIFEARTGVERVAVLLEFVGRLVCVEVSEGALLAV